MRLKFPMQRSFWHLPQHPTGELTRKWPRLQWSPRRDHWQGFPNCLRNSWADKGLKLPWRTHAKSGPTKALLGTTCRILRQNHTKLRWEGTMSPGPQMHESCILGHQTMREGCPHPIQQSEPSRDKPIGGVCWKLSPSRTLCLHIQLAAHVQPRPHLRLLSKGGRHDSPNGFHTTGYPTQETHSSASIVRILTTKGDMQRKRWWLVGNHLLLVVVPSLQEISPDLVRAAEANHRCHEHDETNWWGFATLRNQVEDIPPAHTIKPNGCFGFLTCGNSSKHSWANEGPSACTWPSLAAAKANSESQCVCKRPECLFHRDRHCSVKAWKTKSKLPVHTVWQTVSPGRQSWTESTYSLSSVATMMPSWRPLHTTGRSGTKATGARSSKAQSAWSTTSTVDWRDSTNTSTGTGASRRTDA